ncbi:5'/3'-nucleotidase SurE [Sandaracinobacteroides saxicola]|uniref:5'-nucleotidase SurE n=1 Tax=Sandaracinobacteroides saxicola TaxID=2759707 RepID=A0A7G5IMX4_9SPHN|nr:5'/3'-nucleotidase SurE [Sandaracinobacteroides saxicola]QMW24716.1 5'/3'-nucleotidase SurE [Sandaracinobacteroides saxicola]
MRILLTNDDGINAPGFAALERIAAQLSDDVWMVAPAEEQSGAGHSLTLTRPLRMRQPGERRFAIAGTPTDSVMMALGMVMKDSPPDLILSGVNRGPNMAEDVTYSGTVSAAMEGTLAGVRSIALSQAMNDYTVGNESFASAEASAADIIRRVAAAPWHPGTLVNINFPTRAEPLGVRVTEQGFRDYGHIAIERRVDPRGYPYFWFGYGREIETPAHRTDLEAVRAGYVSVTPLHLDLTAREAMAALAATLE